LSCKLSAKKEERLINERGKIISHLSKDSAWDKNKLKVFYIYKDFDIYNGLIETFLILSKKKAMLPFDFEVCVFSNKKDEYSKIYKANGGILINLGSRWGSNPLILFKLYKLFRRNCPDVVQTFVLKPNLFGITAAILAKVPVVIATDLTLKDQAPNRLRRLRDKLLYRIYVGLANRADHVLCVSEAGRKQLKEFGVNAGISVIPSPIDMEETIKGYQERGDRSHKLQMKTTIGIVARLSEDKRHIDLLEAFAILSKKYPGIYLLIVGDGPLRTYLETMSRRLQIQDKVSFVGFQKDVRRYLRAMDIFALPSRTEALGMAIMEAMAWGLPVVASRVGGIPEIVDDHVTGLLFDPGNVGQLSNALSQLIEDPEKRKAFGENAREKAYQSFQPENFIDRHYQLYCSLMDQKVVSTSR